MRSFFALVATSIVVGLCAFSVAAQAVASNSPAKPADVKPTVSPDNSSIKVSFDAASPGVVYVISATGEQLRIDTNNKSVETIKAEATTVASTPAADSAPAPAAAAKTKDQHAYDFDKSSEPYDYRVVNIPTPKLIPKGSWSVAFTHRFSEPVKPIKESAKDLFGLDSSAVPAFALYYGITSKLYAEAQRSPICQRGICRDIEVGLGYTWIAQDTNSHFALTTYASIEGNNNFSRQYTYNLEAMMSARLGKRVFLFFDPALHLKTNGERRFDPKAEDFFPPSTVADAFRQPVNGGSFGVGASVMITPTLLGLFDFTPRVGFKMGSVIPIFDRNFNVVGFSVETHPTIGFGLQKNVGKHAFALTFSNTQTTTTSKYNSSNLAFTPKHVTIGFNISRRF